ncbi:DNA topoisomerase 2 [Camellia lanceoleosa]|uniref:DNA topoisomerase 2 n=1 Tax=Camellia lanceoleosa TaxID=1840588 RepID=A0ACC0J4X5_9ERIC|nr:DNA topoisomerase 2 [Camellia lanceoleosa]
MLMLFLLMGKVNGKKVSALYYGPDENCHVPIYRMVLTKFPISLSREKWSVEERTNLAKGIKQQLQELLFQKSVDLMSNVEGSIEDSNDFGSIVASIRDLDITPKNIRSYLPKVNWERLASMYRHGSLQCENVNQVLSTPMKVFSNNMGKKSEPVITKCKESENWTNVTFKPDLAKFNMTHLEDDVVALMKKRVIDLAGCLGKTVKVELNGQRIPKMEMNKIRDELNVKISEVRRLQIELTRRENAETDDIADGLKRVIATLEKENY